MTRPDWGRWPPVAACGRWGGAVGRVGRGLLAGNRGRGTSCESSRDTGPDPRVPRKPRPEPCRHTARCRAHRGPVAAPARSTLGAAWAVAWLRWQAAWAPDAGRASPGARPGSGRPRPCLPAEQVLRWPSWRAPVVVGRRQGNLQDLREFFLDLDDCLGLAELFRQPPSFSLEPLVFGDQGGVRVGLSPATLGSQTGPRPFVALPPPGGQVRRVQALAAQQSTELAWFGTPIGLAENAKLVLGGETTPHGLLRYGRVWDRLSVARGRSPRAAAPRGRGGRGGGRNSSRATPSFRSARHRHFHSQHPCFLHPSTTSLPSTVITKEAVVSPIIGTEGRAGVAVHGVWELVLEDS